MGLQEFVTLFQALYSWSHKDPFQLESVTFIVFILNVDELYHIYPDRLYHLGIFNWLWDTNKIHQPENVLYVGLI